MCKAAEKNCRRIETVAWFTRKSRRQQIPRARCLLTSDECHTAQPSPQKRTERRTISSSINQSCNQSSERQPRMKKTEGKTYSPRSQRSRMGEGGRGATGDSKAGGTVAVTPWNRNWYGFRFYDFPHRHKWCRNSDADAVAYISNSIFCAPAASEMPEIKTNLAKKWHYTTVELCVWRVPLQIDNSFAEYTILSHSPRLRCRFANGKFRSAAHFEKMPT